MPRVVNRQLLLLFLMLHTVNNSAENVDFKDYCDLEEKDCTIDKTHKYRYILYDVNAAEGFNLRRDVYMRVAVFAYKFKKSTNKNLGNFKLVLPPWSNMYHWKHNFAEKIPWSYFFDMESLQQFAPVIELYQFFEEIGIKYSKIKIEDVYILQHFEDMFSSGKFEEKMLVHECNKKHNMNFFFYENITSDNIKCLSFHGHVSYLQQILENSNAKTILFHHAEVALHDMFGDKTYWKARRSMRFNKELLDIANKYRKTILNSTDEVDSTKLPDNWIYEKPKRTAKGGPYLSVHLRRRDFARSRPNDVPSIANAAKQISNLLHENNLNMVFVATDASDQEYSTLVKDLTPKFKVFRYVADDAVKYKFKDGGIAIIDQIICSYARYFVGTHESTFTFRIQEEREILGFPVETTFNRLCGDNNQQCEKPSVWKIVY